jgi:hypothetical protein
LTFSTKKLRKAPIFVVQLNSGLKSEKEKEMENKLLKCKRVKERKQRPIQTGKVKSLISYNYILTRYISEKALQTHNFLFFWHREYNKNKFFHPWHFSYGFTHIDNIFYLNKTNLIGRNTNKKIKSKSCGLL